MDDAHLLELARSGDEPAFVELFERHADDLFRYAVVRLRSRETALDVVSYVFGEAWRQRHRIETQDASLRPWLFAVARNRTARQIAERLRRADRVLPDQVTTDHADRVAERLDAATVFPAVLEAIDRLPAGARETLLLHVWGGLTYEQIAAELGVEIGTVKSRLNRARQRLVAELQPNRVPESNADVLDLFTSEDPT